FCSFCLGEVIIPAQFAKVELSICKLTIKQFLPGQRSPKTLELISKKLLGEQSLMNASVSMREADKSAHEHMSETSRPLMTPDEIRRTPYAILLVRQRLPLLVEPVSYAQIKPWRDQAGINPYHGQPFKQKVKAKL
ncbi:MAG: TraM recognition domain-containing protein, partial [Algicola sp.]|nr:TraM recognition domain-containing protein [Algicola sp.]